ncbi:MAG: hypothetical protein QUS14_03865 [Pyrinomonadaceae bacterium]|nr:hypothetical protein [Pyrinomonadaceae bacterium]
MTRPEVERAVTEPPDHFSFDDKNGTVTWHWTAGSRKGPLMQESGDVTSKTDQTLTVLFDSQGKVADVRLGP